MKVRSRLRGRKFSVRGSPKSDFFARYDPKGGDRAKKLKRAGNLVEHHRIKGALHGYFALGIEHLYVQESFQYMNAFLRKEKQQKNADEELENIAAVKKQLTHGKA